MGTTKIIKDPRESIASTNNNKKLNDSNKTENYVDPVTGTDVTAGHVLQNKRLSDMSDTERDLMYQEGEDFWSKRDKDQGNLFNAIVDWYSLDKDKKGEAGKNIQSMTDALKWSEAIDGKMVEKTGLDNKMDSDAHMLGRFGDLFTRDGNTATWSGKFYDTGDEKADHSKNVDLAKAIFGRYKKDGSHFVPAQDRAEKKKQWGVETYPEGVEALLKATQQTGSQNFGEIMGDTDLSSALQNYIKYKN